MVFGSFSFLIFFLPLFLLGYFLLANKFKNAFLLLSSLLFYAWGAPVFVFYIICTTLIDFFLVKWMYNQKTAFKRKLVLVFSIAMNTGLLLYFKYSNFFIESINQLLISNHITPIGWTQVMLPIGISFFTFESITYVMDVYRGVHKPLKRFWEYQLYIIFFPKLIAGPIVRYHEIADQIENRYENETFENRVKGFHLFVIGLAKKVLLSNTLAETVDGIFSLSINQLDGVFGWIGAIAFSFQIYFDFAGYSDMAIGLGRMMGFKLPENFNNPLCSASFTEFWTRWHISLGRWLFNYLYLPLGGSRTKTKIRAYFNLFLIFFVSGLWHGAGWNFVLWGVFIGVIVVLERIFLLRLYEKTGRYFSMLITYALFCISLVIFRVPEPKAGLNIIKKMLVFNSDPDKVLLAGKDFWFFFLLTLMFSFSNLVPQIKSFASRFYIGDYTIQRSLLYSGLGLVVFLVCMSFLSGNAFSPFFYFKF